ncbi:heterokaryon incompatibility protein-domain-containing protein [Paraphoma chrysanthemicola]|uniref:Heterokaryon incompatibility protein-domain-containing protein n=1 Tax=Paraphoma chrysanthemicola TaxID=798071 RepID=A0A8K0RDJ9_9PLEO|nr:heterokaryon incompatibility protein-domain-containing protein [Paraphoma chrysanthemicola]
MSEQILCCACQSFLEGSRVRDHGTREVYVHHTDGDSLVQAWKMGCVLCTALWSEFSTDVIDHQAKTSWSIMRSSASTYPRSSWLFDFTFYPQNGTYDRQRPVILENYESTSAPCGKNLGGHTGDDFALDFLAKQYKTCKETHVKCQQATCSPFLPSRVLDVGSRGDSSISLRPREQLAISEPYLTLSHCWGDFQPLKLTRYTASHLELGIHVADLPKTYQEAVQVSRRLGYRYLWIDSLCIYQDNLDDWQAEAGQMGDIYGKAAGCIAATASVDSSYGLFRPRRSDQAPIKVSVARSEEPSLQDMPPPGTYWCSFAWSTPRSHIDEAALNLRAWVAQERYLSTRVMHFTRDLLFWECLELLSNEVNLNGIPSSGLNFEDSEVNLFKLHFRNFDAQQSASQNASRILPSPVKLSKMDYDMWYEFVRAYTRFSMTKQGDCLAALSGIAKNIGQATGARFVAGLWEQNIVDGLCWDVAQQYDPNGPLASTRPTVWRAPSWSWASVTKMVYYLKTFLDMRSSVDILDYFVEEHPSGQITSAQITLRCRLVPIELHRWDGPKGWGLTKTYDKHAVPPYILSFDDPSSIAPRTTEQTSANLIILRDDNRGSFHGLLIIRSKDHKDAFERIGLLCYYDRNYEPSGEEKLPKPANTRPGWIEKLRKHSSKGKLQDTNHDVKAKLPDTNHSFKGTLRTLHDEAEPQIITLV